MVFEVCWWGGIRLWWCDGVVWLVIVLCGVLGGMLVRGIIMDDWVI